jgi:multidrug efflux pump
VFSRFFIDRPIFAAVLSIVTALTGAVAVVNLPVAQYPQITPPSIIVQCTYPGASAQVVAESVAAPIEQQVNGVEDMLYMSSQSGNDGSYSLTVTFKPGVNMNFAQVLVQNRVNLALPLLPDVVKQTGLTTRKRNPDILLIVSLYSPHSRYDQLYLSNYATIQVADEIKRVDGVGDVFMFGQQDYSMRVWVDPDRLASLNLTAGDVLKAIREQNQQVAAGQIGQQPSPGGRPFEFTVTTLGRLSDPEQFADIILRTTPDGRKVHIRDVGHVALGARNQDVTSRLDGHPNSSLAVFQLPYANAIATADRVRAKMEELKQTFPEDLDYAIAYDTTPFISESIHEVFRTLAEAIILVAVVVLVFLQNWRSTIIPLVAVPVAIIGTFAVMAAIGFSLNNLTLFGLVLAIGIVVDDAIVVVEAVEHHIEEGMAPRQAAYRAMEEVSGPVVAVALVLSAVFIPCAFVSGITGQFFRQFALTIAVSTIISAFNSLTLSPALAALLLKPRGARKDPLGRLFDLLLGWFFRLFNWAFRRTTGAYTRAVGLALRGSAVALVLYGGLLALTWWGFTRLPTGYIPVQDQAKLYVAVQLPDSASLRRTQEVVDHITDIVRHTPGVLHTISVAGQSFTLSANGSNFGNLFVTLDDFDKRRDPKLSSDAIADQMRTQIAREVPEAKVTILGPPPVAGLGSSGGFKFIVEDRSGEGDLRKLQQQAERLIAASRPRPPEKTAEFKGLPKRTAVALPAVGASTVGLLGSPSGQDSLLAAAALLCGRTTAVKTVEVKRAPQGAEGALAKADPTATDVSKGEAKKGTAPTEFEKAETKGGPKGDPGDPKVAGLFTVFRADSPQLYVDLNRDQCQTMGVNPQDVFTTLQVYLGSYYVNDFNKFGRSWQVVVQAQAPFRDDVDKVKRLKVRNASGDMVPLGAVLTVREISGPLLLTRYNMYPAAAIVGNTKPGVSSGQGIDAMQRLADKVLPKSMAYEWTEINFIQIDASKNVGNNLIFPLAVVFVFLVLAAQYESWALPLAVILVVPMCILGSLAGVALAHSDINIFTQIGFVVLVGLASKNAILIVEFAKHKKESGLSRHEATLQAVRLRLRPILMTSFAFILGVVPLILATGAGHEMRRALGVAVFAGMLGVTLFGIFLTPVFFNVIEWFMEAAPLSSEPARQAGRALRVVAGVLTLGLAWLPALVARGFRWRPAPARPAPAKLPAPAANGATRGHAAVPAHDGNGQAADGESKRVLRK